MLVALKNNNRIEAEHATKKDNPFTCPKCKGKYVLRKGIHNIPHFAHITGDEDCILRFDNSGGGESIHHLKMKKIIKKAVEKDNTLKISEYEYPIKNRIADYYCELRNGVNHQKIAFECVYQHNDLKDFMEKCDEYSKNNTYIFPIFHVSKIINEDNTFKEYFMPSEIMLNVYKMMKMK